MTLSEKQFSSQIRAFLFVFTCMYTAFYEIFFRFFCLKMRRFYGFSGYAAQILFDYLRLFALCSYKYDYKKQKGKNRRKNRKRVRKSQETKKSE